MKLKGSILALAATFGIAANASAVTIDIVGSTAGRAAVYTRITELIQPGYTSAASGSSLSGSNQAIIHGVFGSTPVIIRLNFTGSAAGVNQVANQLQVPFFAETVGTSGNTTGVAFSGGNLANSAPELGYSDVFQSTTTFTTPRLNTEDEVAVIPFQFFKSRNGAAGLTNVTSQQVRNLYGALGDSPLSLFTGLAADSGVMVYATGRDASSGTRITAFAETGTSQTAVSQYQPVVASGAVSSLGPVSDSGFGSGSSVAAVLNATYSGGIIIGYLGASDFPNPVSASTAQPLTFNGVTYSAEAVYEGSYSFWGYLHQFRQNLTGTELSFYNALRDALTTNPGSGVLPLGNMKVARDGDGFSIYPSAP